jgi:hypothetical protein
MPQAPLGPTVLSKPSNLLGSLIEEKMNVWCPVAAVPSAHGSQFGTS